MPRAPRSSATRPAFKCHAPRSTATCTARRVQVPRAPRSSATCTAFKCHAPRVQVPRPAFKCHVHRVQVPRAPRSSATPRVQVPRAPRSMMIMTLIIVSVPLVPPSSDMPALANTCNTLHTQCCQKFNFHTPLKPLAANQSDHS